MCEPSFSQDYLTQTHTHTHTEGERQKHTLKNKHKNPHSLGVQFPLLPRCTVGNCGKEVPVRAWPKIAWVKMHILQKIQTCACVNGAFCFFVFFSLANLFSIDLFTLIKISGSNRGPPVCSGLFVQPDRKRERANLICVLCFKSCFWFYFSSRFDSGYCSSCLFVGLKSVNLHMDILVFF